jgi:hypothetical protein
MRAAAPRCSRKTTEGLPTPCTTRVLSNPHSLCEPSESIRVDGLPSAGPFSILHGRARAPTSVGSFFLGRIFGRIFFVRAPTSVGSFGRIFFRAPTSVGSFFSSANVGRIFFSHRSRSAWTGCLLPGLLASCMAAPERQRRSDLSVSILHGRARAPTSVGSFC